MSIFISYILKQRTETNLTENSITRHRFYSSTLKIVIFCVYIQIKIFYNKKILSIYTFYTYDVERYKL